MKKILPISFREGDRHAQPGEQPLEDREWAETSARGPQLLGQRLAHQLVGAIHLDPSAGFERTIETPSGTFPECINIHTRDEALEKAQWAQGELVL